MKLSQKLTFSVFAALVVVCGFAFYFHFRLMLASEQEDLETLGSTVGRVIEESLAHCMIIRDMDLLNRTLLDIREVEPISRILLLNNQNRVMAGTEPASAGKSLDVLDAALPWSDPDRKGTAGVKGYRWVQRVRNRPACHSCHASATHYNGSIVIDFSTDTVRTRIGEHIVKESLLFLAAFCVSGLIAFFLFNGIVIRRLVRVIDYMKRFKNGEEAVRIPLTGDDEIAWLGLEFNEMADSISDSQEEHRKYAGELLSLAVASHVVSAVPRTEDIHQAICSVAVRELKVTMAWIGMVKQGAGEVEAVAESGFDENFLPWMNSAGAEFGSGPVAAVLRKKVPRVVNDIATEPDSAEWKSEAVKRGCRSLMALPLLSTSGEVLGVLTLCSDSPEFFTRKRVRMFMVFSNQAATEIENRALMDSLEKSRAELARQIGIISRSQAEWKLTFDSITDMVSIHDRDFRIIRANRAVAEYLGIPPHRLLNHKCHALFHGTCSPHENCPHRSSVERKQAATEEVRDPRTGKLFRVSTFPYYNETGDFVGSVHVARDITLEKETEMRLVKSERLAALGQMASGLAHEINTPLASIAGCAEGLLMKVRNGRYDPDVFEEYLRIVEEEIQRCKSITTGMLSFVRQSTYEPKGLNINDALDKALDIIGFQGRLKYVSIDRRYGKNLPAVHGSEGELRQVFLAITLNALDAMDDAGMLTLETGSGDESIFIRISDTGPGIAPENISRIFDPFFTTKSDKGGTGLGLSIAYKIISNHGGMLDVFSEEGHGAVFLITLPVQAGPEQTAPHDG